MRDFNKHVKQMAQHVNVNEEFINNLFLDTANEFLKDYTNNENLKMLWKATPEFWAWWQQIWINRDRMILKRYPHRITANHRREMYKIWHSPEFMQARPSSKAYRAFICIAKQKRVFIK